MEIGTATHILDRLEGALGLPGLDQWPDGAVAYVLDGGETKPNGTGPVIALRCEADVGHVDVGASHFDCELAAFFNRGGGVI